MDFIDIHALSFIQEQWDDEAGMIFRQVKMKLGA